MTVSVFYFLTTNIMNSIQNESLYHEDGRDKDFDTISIGDDDFPFVKTLLEDSANEVFEILHKLTEDVEDADGEELEPFVFDEEIIDKEGNYIAYTLQFPDNFNINLIKPIDRAIRGCLIAKTLLKWMERKGRNIEKLAVSEIKSIYRLKRSINLRSTLKKTYRMY